MSRINGCPFLVCLLFLDAFLCLFPSYKFSLIKRKKESVKPLSLPTFKEGTTAIQGNVISTYNPNMTKQKKNNKFHRLCDESLLSLSAGHC